jgi:hypothetical protein
VKDTVGFLAFVGGMMLIVLVFAWTLGYLFGSTACDNRWSESGFAHRYEIIGGCMIEVEGVWIPEDRYRAIE